MTVTSPSSASPAPSGPSPFVQQARRWFDEARVHVARWAAGDFARIQARPQEREALAASPAGLTDPLVQDYLAWRRSMVWVALVLSVAGIVDSAVDFFGTETGGETGVTGFAAFFMLLILSSRVWLGVALTRSALGWADPRGGRGRLRLGWAVALFVPVFLVQLPLADLVIEMPAAGEAGGEAIPGLPGVSQQAVMRTLMGVLFGVQGFVMALPGLTSLFPGAMRAGLLLKTLLPGRSMGAVVSLTLGPIYALLLLVLMTFLQQAASSALFFFGALLLFAGPLLTFRSVWSVVPPLTSADLAPRMARVRLLGRMATWGGLSLLLLGLFTTKVFGHRLLGVGDGIIGLGDLLSFAAWFLAMLTAYTVVSADGLLQTMRLADDVRQASLASAQFASDGQVLERLERAVGMPAPSRSGAPPVSSPSGGT